MLPQFDKNFVITNKRKTARLYLTAFNTRLNSSVNAEAAATASRARRARVLRPLEQFLDAPRRAGGQCAAAAAVALQ